MNSFEETGAPRRICIVGSSGSGKSTLSKKLGKRLGLPIVHLDQIYWLPGWQAQERELAEAELHRVLKDEEWIIDGCFLSTLTKRLKRTQLVIWLDYPTWVCLWSVCKRVIQNWGTTRSNMAPGCEETFDWEFLKYVYHFRNRSRPAIAKGLEDWEGPVLRFTQRSKLASWLKANEVCL